MYITDIPTLFQIATAQESNSRQLEALGNVIEFQQTEIEKMKKIVATMQDLVEEVVNLTQATKWELQVLTVAKEKTALHL